MLKNSPCNLTVLLLPDTNPDLCRHKRNILLFQTSIAISVAMQGPVNRQETFLFPHHPKTIISSVLLSPYDSATWRAITIQPEPQAQNLVDLKPA